MTHRVFNVLIVGCGNIAGGFDTMREKKQPPQTHAGAFSMDKRFNITACVEPDNAKRAEFATHWSIPSHYPTLEAALNAVQDIDIVSLCSPTQLHAQHLSTALMLKPALIFCEKPITPSYQESYNAVAACKAAGVALCINHNRRWDPKIHELKHALADKKYGELRSVIGYYNKGILNNGSHLIDTLQLLLGDLQIVAATTPIHDYHSHDPSISALLTSAQGTPVHLVTGHAQDYSLFQLQFIFSNRMITMETGGQSWFTQEVIDNPMFSGYKSLDEGHRHQGQYAYTTCNALDNMYQHLTTGTALLSTGETALAAQRICEHIHRLQFEQQPQDVT